MSYMNPGVRVEQILTNTSATLIDVDLYPTIVGPLYRVVADRTVKAAGAIAHPVGNPVLTTTYPILDPGSIVDLDSVKVYVFEGWVNWLTQASGSILVSNGSTYTSGFMAGMQYFTDPSVDFLATGVKAGDKLYIGTAGSDNGMYIVDSVEQHTLYFRTKIYKTISTDLPYTITRFYEKFYLDPLDYLAQSDKCEIDVCAVVTGSGTSGVSSHDFASGEIRIEYRALRKDYTGLKTFENSEQVEAQMEVDIQNPLGWDLVRAGFAANGNTHPILSYILDDDSDTAYINALADLATTQKTYFLVPITMSSQVTNAYAAHAVQMSDWKISYFRLALVSTPLITEKTLVTGDVVMPVNP